MDELFLYFRAFSYRVKIPGQFILDVPEDKAYWFIKRIFDAAEGPIGQRFYALSPEITTCRVEREDWIKIATDLGIAIESLA